MAAASVVVAPNRKSENVEVGNKQRGARARNRGDVRDLSVGSALRFKHVDKTCFATDVDPTTLGVDEEVVEIAASVSASDNRTVFSGTHAKPRWTARNRQDAAI